VCGYQCVALMISGNVAPAARFISAMTLAFLLARSDFGLPAAILARGAVFAGLAFLVAWRFALSACQYYVALRLRNPSSDVAIFSA
jgi:hypothetical protein